MITTGMASALMAMSLYPEARYAFEPKEPIDIGQLADAQFGPTLSGSYVRARVALEEKPTLSFRRPGEAERRITALSASTPRFVEYIVPDAGPRFVPPRVVAGRLARVGELGLRHRGLSDDLDALVPGSSANGWVLVDGEDPRGAEWAVALEVVLLGFFAFNAAGVWRIRRRKPVKPIAPKAAADAADEAPDAASAAAAD
jgi:hypothetical protein